MGDVGTTMGMHGGPTTASLCNTEFYVGAPSKHSAGSPNINSPCNGCTVEAISHAGKLTRADSAAFRSSNCCGYSSAVT